MAHLGARVGRRGAGADRALAGQPAAAVVAAVALAALFPRPAQVTVERAPLALVLPEVPIDRLVADRELLVEPPPPGALLGAPVLPHQGLHAGPIRRREPPIAPRAGAPAARIPVSELGAVGAIAPRAI